MFELLKNSLRAVVERYGVENEDHFPAIKVIVVEGKEDITIKISDEGGGIPRSEMPLVWTYMYTTAQSEDLGELLACLLASSLPLLCPPLPSLPPLYISASEALTPSSLAQTQTSKPATSRPRWQASGTACRSRASTHATLAEISSSSPWRATEPTYIYT